MPGPRAAKDDKPAALRGVGRPRRSQRRMDGDGSIAIGTVLNIGLHDAVLMEAAKYDPPLTKSSMLCILVAEAMEARWTQSH